MKKLVGNAQLCFRAVNGIGTDYTTSVAMADLAVSTVTNGGYNGQQVLRLSTSLSPKPHQIKLRRTPESER
jgi:hypothetical protein